MKKEALRQLAVQSQVITSVIPVRRNVFKSVPFLFIYNNGRFFLSCFRKIVRTLFSGRSGRIV